MSNDKKREFTGLHIGTAEDWEGFFLAKAAKEKELGRTLTESEATDLLAEISKKENIQTIWVEKNKEDVKAIISEHFNVKKLGPSEEGSS